MTTSVTDTNTLLPRSLPVCLRPPDVICHSQTSPPEEPLKNRCHGVACALGILRRELRTTMALCGQTSVKGLARDLISRVD